MRLQNLHNPLGSSCGVVSKTSLMTNSRLVPFEVHWFDMVSV